MIVKATSFQLFSVNLFLVMLNHYLQFHKHHDVDLQLDFNFTLMLTMKYYMDFAETLSLTLYMTDYVSGLCSYFDFDLKFNPKFKLD